MVFGGRFSHLSHRADDQESKMAFSENSSQSNARVRLAPLNEIASNWVDDLVPCETNDAERLPVGIAPFGDIGVPQSEIVFVVDGDRQRREKLIADVKRQGYPVTGLHRVDDLKQNDWEMQSGCILLDVPLLEQADPGVLHWLAYANSILPLILISATKDISTAVDAVKAGAVDFLPRPISTMRLCRAIESAMGVSRQRSFERARKNAAIEGLAILTPTEIIVARLLAQGNPGKVIAGALGRSENTIKVHRGRILRKLKIDSVVKLSRLLGVADMLDDELHL